MKPLFESFLCDRSYRHITYFVCGITSVIYGFLRLLFRASKFEGTLETLILFCSLLVVGVLLRPVLRKHSAIHVRPDRVPANFRLVLTYLCLGVALFGITLTNIAVRLQAAVFASAVERATRSSSTTVPPVGYQISSFVELSGKKLQFVGKHSSLILLDDIAIENSSVIFDGIDFRGPSSGGGSLIVLGHASSVVVRDASVESLDQTLDGITWINVEFQHATIRANNGPFVLVNVVFKDCDLRWLSVPPAWGRAGDELLEKIRTANGRPITFAYEGAPLPAKSQTK